MKKETKKIRPIASCSGASQEDVPERQVLKVLDITGDDFNADWIKHTDPKATAQDRGEKPSKKSE